MTELEDVTDCLPSSPTTIDKLEEYRKSLDKLDIPEPTGKYIPLKKFLIKIFRVFEKIGCIFAGCLCCRDFRYETELTHVWHSQEQEKKKKNENKNEV